MQWSQWKSAGGVTARESGLCRVGPRKPRPPESDASVGGCQGWDVDVVVGPAPPAGGWEVGGAKGVLAPGER